MTWLHEFEQSGISRELALSNAFYLEGILAVEEHLGTLLGRNKGIAGCGSLAAKRIANRFEFLQNGAWFANPANKDTPPYCKPVTPRIGEKGKPVKYETPPHAICKPLLPNLEKACLLKEIWGVSTWEDILSNQSIPIVITEGWKKALALVEYGYPAIAIRGITQWHPKGESKVYPEIEQYCRGGRLVYLVFDQDEKPKTRKQVFKQLVKLGNAVRAAGGDPKFVAWDGTVGKGIDDYLVTFPAVERRSQLERLLRHSTTKPQVDKKALARVCLKGYREPSTQFTSIGRYLEPIGRIQYRSVNWIDAPLGTGKTTRIGEDWVKPAIRKGDYVLVFTPLNSLGKQVAANWGLPHLQDYPTTREGEERLRADICRKGGLVCCPESAVRAVNLFPESVSPIVVIEEADDILLNASKGETLKLDWSDSLRALREALAKAPAVVISQSRLSADTLTIVKRLSGKSADVGIRHIPDKTSGFPVTYLVGQSPAEFLERLVRDLKSCHQVLLVTTSQWLAAWVEEAILAEGIDRVYRIDSTTNADPDIKSFFTDPDNWERLVQPRLVILSPCGGTGLSIEGGVAAENAYFTRVYGAFPCLAPNDAFQMLGRYRPPVERVVWSPRAVAPGYDSTLLWQLDTQLDLKMAKEYSIKAGVPITDPPEDLLAIRQYLRRRLQHRVAACSLFSEVLVDLLQQQGCDVQVIDAPDPTPEQQARIDAAKNRAARRLASEFASTSYNPALHTREWIAVVENSHTATWKQRLTAEKAKWSRRAPTLDWNDPDLAYHALFHEKRQQRLARPCLMVAEADARVVRRLGIEDTELAAFLLTKPLPATHRLPKRGLRAALNYLFHDTLVRIIHKKHIHPTDPDAAKVRDLALQHRDYVQLLLGIKVDESLTPEATTAKLLRKWGLQVSRMRALRVDRKLRWFYQIVVPPYWWRLVKAFRSQLKEDAERPSPMFGVILISRRSLNNWGTVAPPPQIEPEGDHPPPPDG